jgi:hypothetical protein
LHVLAGDLMNAVDLALWLEIEKHCFLIQGLIDFVSTHEKDWKSIIWCGLSLAIFLMHRCLPLTA